MVLLASSFDKSKYLKAADLEKEKKFRIKSAKLKRTQPKPISSALPPIATVGRTFPVGSFVPVSDIT